MLATRPREGDVCEDACNTFWGTIFRERAYSSTTIPHWRTRTLAEILVSNLRRVGQQEKAEALADKHGLASDMQPPPRCTLLRKCVWRLKLFGSRLQAG